MGADEQRRQTSDHDQQPGEDEQPQRVSQDRLYVERHAGRDEEQRDEDAVADSFELGLKRFGVHFHPVCPAAQHHARQHGTQDHIQAEPLGGHQQKHEQHNRPAQRGLSRRSLALFDQFA